MHEVRCHAILWFFRKLAAVTMIEEANSSRQRNELEAQTPQRQRAGAAA